MPIDTKHKQYDAHLNKWQLVRDCLDEDAIEGNTKYLPQPENRDEDDHIEYICSAFFYGVCAWTRTGMVGSVFRKPGEIQLPNAIDYLADDIDGCGVTATEQAKATCSTTLALGRKGLLLDHPLSPDGLSKKDVAALNLRWNVISYEPENIINWRETVVGGVTQLSLVVLKEVSVTDADAFEQNEHIRYRYLSLTPDGLEVQLWTALSKEPKHIKDYAIEIFTPEASGKRISFIPFVFVGAEDNKSTVNKPPFSSLAKANLAHYRNSADWEQAVHMAGQPTLYMSGMTEEFIDLLKKVDMFPFKMGSKGLLPIPPGGEVGLVESMSDKTLIERAMDRKERLMAMLGAKLIEDKKQVEATDTHRIREGGKTSVLRNVVDNAEKAYKKIFVWAALLNNLNPDEVEFKLNHDFFEQPMSAKEAVEWMSVWQGGGMSKHDYHSIMQKGEAIAEGRTREDVDGDLAQEVGDLPRVSDGS